MSGMSASLCPFREFFLILERAKNIRGTKSGEEGG
jgi:hypothetical protein